jgi:hypothetical protein
MKGVTSGEEKAVVELSTEAVEELRRETCRILRKTKMQKNNSSNAERDALIAKKGRRPGHISN